MTNLSPEARALVETSRNAAELTRAERERIKRGVLVQVATLGAASATAGTAAAMSLASKITLVAVSAAVLGGGAVALWAARERPAAPSVAAQDSRSPKKAALALPPPALPQEEVTVASPSANPGPSDGKKPSRRPLATGAPTTGSAATAAIAPFDPELEVLRQAREDLRQGLAESAYQRLVDFDRRHGSGVLGQERQALSAIALCQWRPGPEAQARVAEFLRTAPESPLAERVRLACERASGVTK